MSRHTHDEERYPIQYDGVFVYAPSFALYEELERNGDGQLFEGKYVGKAKEVDLVFLDKDRTMDAFIQPEKYAAERKIGVTVGKRAFKTIAAATHDALWSEVQRYTAGGYAPAAFKKAVTRVMKRAWRDAFLAGVRSTGIAGRGAGHAGVALGPDDEEWLKSAMKHEMRFLNGFVNAIVEETYRMPLPRRVKMYIDALESFYDSARVIGMPATSVLRWTGKRDERVCASCRYLHAHNPYHKLTLPTVPRAGLTICLTNCRDRLLVRVVGSTAALDVLQGSRFTRDQHVRNLLEIKRRRELPARLATR